MAEEKKVAIRSLVFDSVEDAMKTIEKKKYNVDDEMQVEDVATSLHTKIMVQVQGDTVLAVKAIPIARFDLQMFAENPDETDEQAQARAILASKTIAMIDALLEKESVRLGKADVALPNFESFLDAMSATRNSDGITVQATKDIIKEWLRANNVTIKERGRTVYFESAAKLIDCIKSNAYALQVFAGSDPQMVDILVTRYYEGLVATFKANNKPTTILDKWFNNRKQAVEKVVKLDDLDDLI